MKQEDVEAKPGCWRKDPAVVLKEIPVGMPVDQARAIMEGHGFECSQHTEEGSSYLLCQAYQRTSILTGTRIDVNIFHQASRVTGAKVSTRYDGP